MKDYQFKAMRTFPPQLNETKIENGVIGLFGEGGEIADLYKKFKYQNHPLNREKMIEELGDVLWYCAMIATGLRTTLDKVAEQNIEKLLKRYPDGFDPNRSMNREPESPVVEIVEVESKITEVDKRLASQIIESRSPEGFFWIKENDKYIGIDNSIGEAWVEEFDTYEKMKSWLVGDEEFEHEE
jgi:NTP pyrophosphatase (non-canonical NTP hydrolase)